MERISDRLAKNSRDVVFGIVEDVEQILWEISLVFEEMDGHSGNLRLLGAIKRTRRCRAGKKRKIEISWRWLNWKIQLTFEEEVGVSIGRT